MGSRVVALIVLVGLVAAGCGDDDRAEGPPLLVLASTVGTAVVDGGTGELQRLATGGTATPDGAVVFETSPAAGPAGPAAAVTVRAFPVGSSSETWAATVPGPFEARVASVDGDAVVLGPSRAGVVLEPGTLAPGRTETPLAVVRPDGSVQQLTVPGNIEPEAFSLDGEALFVVSYQPAEAPTFYQVRRLDLATGELGDVFSVDAELQETMRGTARTQVWDPDGDRLYTLYTLDSGSAFVHVLDLDEQWAHCVDLPAGIGATSAGLALSDDGRTLYAGDVAGGGIAEVDTEELVVTDEGELPRSPLGLASSVAVDGRELYVASGPDIHVVDRGSLEPVDRYVTAGPILGLQVGDDLYAVQPESVAVLDRDDGTLVRSFAVDVGPGSILAVGHSIPTYAGIQCAC